MLKTSVSPPIAIGIRCSTSIQGIQSDHVAAVEFMISLTLLVMLKVNVSGGLEIGHCLRMTSRIRLSVRM